MVSGPVPSLCEAWSIDSCVRLAPRKDLRTKSMPTRAFVQPRVCLRSGATCCREPLLDGQPGAVNVLGGGDQQLLQVSR